MSSSKQYLQTRPPGFLYRESRRGVLRRTVQPVLHCEGIALTTLAEKYGTPLYIYSSATIEERLRDFKRALRDVPHTICYSVKANSNLTLLRVLAKRGCGFDVVSGGELERVLIADRKADPTLVVPCSIDGRVTARALGGLVEAGVQAGSVASARTWPRRRSSATPSSSSRGWADRWPNASSPPAQT